MARIKLLDEDTVNKIAAGEVIERPASAVKEMVENSIDSGATRILVELEEGGRNLIKVIDDGCGMDPEDLSLAFQKHATSKIRSASDLSNISTMGFRGEALASIASVAGSVEVYTKTSSAMTGTYVKMEGGKIPEIKDVGWPAGTAIIVRDLFKNVPARRKYLKGAGTELLKVTELITEMAIINYKVSFELISGKRSLFKSNRSKSWNDILIKLLGLKVAKGLISFQAEAEGCSFTGVVSDPTSSRSTPDWIYTFVNARAIYSKALVSAVREAYRSSIPSGRSPIAVVSLEIDPALVDVNIHPTKREVRFLHEEEMAQALTGGISQALTSRMQVQKAEISQRYLHPPTPSPGRMILTQKQETLTQETPSPLVEVKMVAPRGDLPEIPEWKAPAVNILGQVMKLYIVAESAEGLVLIDQHAAAERVRYETLRNRYRDRRISQELAEPVNIDLSPKEQVLLDAWKDVLAEIGFQICPFGGSTYSVKAVPALGGRTESPEAIHDVLRDLFAMGKVSQDSTFKEDILKLLACRGSVKSGRELSMGEMRSLLRDLYACESPETCPHGRPVAAVLDGDKLERIFGRKYQ